MFTYEYRPVFSRIPYSIMLAVGASCCSRIEQHRAKKMLHHYLGKHHFLVFFGRIIWFGLKSIGNKLNPLIFLDYYKSGGEVDHRLATTKISLVFLQAFSLFRTKKERESSTWERNSKLIKDFEKKFQEFKQDFQRKVRVIFLVEFSNSTW